MKLRGKVIDAMKINGSNAMNVSVPGAKVFISDENGKITSMKVHALTDKNGDFELEVPTIKNPIIGMPSIPNVDGKYLTASYGGKTDTKSLDSGDFNFNLSKAKVSDLPEVTIVAKKREKTTTPGTSIDLKNDPEVKGGFSWKNMEPWQKGVVVGLSFALITVIGIGMYNAAKQS